MQTVFLTAPLTTDKEVKKAKRELRLAKKAKSALLARLERTKAKEEKLKNMIEENKRLMEYYFTQIKNYTEE